METQGRAVAYQLTWEDLKKLLIDEYCRKDKFQKLEFEFWNHSMVGAEVQKYIVRFHELTKLVSYIVTPQEKHIDCYIWAWHQRSGEWSRQQIQLPFRVQ